MANEKICIDKNKEPEKFAGRNYQVLREDASGNLLWNILRHISSGNQKVPSFPGWQVLVREIANVATKKTVMTYLLPINAPVNTFSTIFWFLTYLQKLCKEVNMSYVNITLDLGAAMPAYKVIWNYPNTFTVYERNFRCFLNVNRRFWIRGYRFSVWNIYDWIPE